MVRLQRFLDKHAGNIAVSLLSPLKIFDTEPKKIKKILIIKLWALGDSVVSLPLIKGIKENYDAEIHVLATKNKVVYECTDLVDKVIGIKDLGLRKYDLVFDTEPYLNSSAIIAFLAGKKRVGFSGQHRSRLYDKIVDFNTKQHMVQNYIDMLRALGKKFDTDELVSLSVDKNTRKKVDRFWKFKNAVGITPGVAESAKARMWYEDRFAELADSLIAKGMDVVFIDGPDNAPVVEKIIAMMKNKPTNTVGMFSLKETFYLISKCRYFISNDTGPMHIAAAQGCKTIGLFGPNTPVLWGPYGKDNIAIYKTKLPPSIVNAKAIFPNRDREGFMSPIQVEDVMEAVARLK